MHEDHFIHHHTVFEIEDCRVLIPVQKSAAEDDAEFTKRHLFTASYASFHECQEGISVAFLVALFAIESAPAFLGKWHGG